MLYKNKKVVKKSLAGGVVLGSVLMMSSCGVEPGSHSQDSSVSSNGNSTSRSTASSTSNSADTITTSSSVAQGDGERVRYDNPFSGARKWYVNPLWQENAIASGGAAIADQPTGVWMDRIGAIEPYGGQSPNNNFGLREHLDAALAQDADLFKFVVYNLPGRDCAAAASNGELPASAEGMRTYKRDYIDRIVGILADEAYAGLRIVAVIEIDSLPNLVTNLSEPSCQDVSNSSPYGYTEGVRYALTQLDTLANVHSYVDAAHSGWLGWDDNFRDGINFLADAIAGQNHAGETPAPGWEAVNGFITNTSNYTPLEEPYLPSSDTVIGSQGLPIRSADFYEWNPYFGETEFARDWRDAMISQHGAPSRIGMLIDTGRNGWGGPDRPTGQSDASDMNDFVNQSRIDRRPHRGSWCNQSGGVGERPTAAPMPGIHAYVWIKPQGESDGVASADAPQDPNDANKQHDPMCDPDGPNRYAEDSDTTRGQDVETGAMPGAPHAGRWFEYGFQVLVDHAYPPLQ